MKQVAVSEIINFLNREGFKFDVYGDLNYSIQGFSSIANYHEDSITWLKSEEMVYDRSRFIAVCVVQKGIKINANVVIESDESKNIFFAILDQFFSNDLDVEKVFIGEGSVIGTDVKIGKDVRIGCNCSISGKVKIGDGTVIHDNVVIKNNVLIGKNCIIQSLSVIGEDGFGYYEDENHIKTMIKHYGGVKIGDNVFIGSHVNIARGTIDDTVIENGVKIAPSTHIGHNNLLQENVTVICSNLYGSVKVGTNAYITASTIKNQCSIGENTMIGIGTVVNKSVEANKVAVGIPVKIIRDNL